MQLPILFVAQPPPILEDDGVLRVGRTRVRLETVINAFNQEIPRSLLRGYLVKGRA